MSIIIIYTSDIKWEVFMEKDIIIDLVSSELEPTQNQKNIIKAIEEAKAEMDRAREIFDLVSEPKMVDYAIFAEQAAKAKLTYLLSEARKYGIKANDEYSLKKADVL